MSTGFFKKSLAAFAAAAVAFGSGGMQPLSTLLGTVARADSGVAYVVRSWNAETKTVEEETRYCSNYRMLSGTENLILTYGWYVTEAGKGFDSSSRLIVDGTVNIILADFVTLYCWDGIRVLPGSTLNIYCQPGDRGTLNAIADTNDNAAIGGDDGEPGGTIRIYGGNITADAEADGDDAAGIGGGNGGSGGTIEIYGGRVTAYGANSNYNGGAGIGGGYKGSGGTVRIYGGTVTATGGANAAGIGGGDSGAGGTVEIYGGTVTAECRNTTDDSGAGIGGGNEGHGGTVRIYDGTVTATGGGDGAGIGGGDSGNGGTIEIYGGNVTASSKTDAAGIGGGEGGGAGGNITISGGTVTATGGKYGAGIGGGEGGAGGDITISGGTVTATGGSEGAGIGGGEGGSGGNISLSGGTVSATGGDNAVAIGGEDGSVYFKGATVQMNTKADSSGVYLQAVKAASISFDDTNAGQRVVYNGNTIAGSGSRAAICTQTGINGVIVEPCTHEGHTCTSINDDKHKWACGNCIYQVEEPHIYSEPVWTWSEDHLSASISMTCTKCSHTASAAATVTNDASKGMYAAAAEFGGKTYTAAYEETVANGPIQYQKTSYNKATGEVEISSAEVSEYFALYDTKKMWGTGTYVLTDNVTISDRITFTGDADLILCDGAKLTAAKGIEVSNGGHLNIYAQENGTGKLIARGSDGTDREVEVSGVAAITGDVTVFGGMVEAYGGNGGVGLGYANWAQGNEGGYGRSGLSGDITVYRGSIKAVGGNGGKGGTAYNSGRGGNGGSGLEGSITIYGGTFELSGGIGGSAGEYSEHPGGNGENGAAITAERAEIYSAATFTNGVPFTLVPAKAATYTENGIKEYYLATNGKSYGKDGNVYTPVTAEELIIAKLQPTEGITAQSLDKVRTFSNGSEGSTPATAAVLTVNVANVSTKIAVTYDGKTRNTDTSIMGNVAIGVIVPAKDDLQLTDFTVKAYVE